MKVIKLNRLILVGVTACVSILPAWSAMPGGLEQGQNGSWKFVVFGDNRGDNKGWNATKDGYKDGGINKPVLADEAAAIKQEQPEFVLVVGDLVTKWTPQLVNIHSNALMASELADWRQIWMDNTGGLPVFPVRGNQEWNASPSVWTDFIKTLPGISAIEQNGPAGEVGFTYSFTCKNVLFVALDEYVFAPSADSPTLAPATLDWLRAQMAAFNKPHVFAYAHAPAYEIWDAKAAAPFTVLKDGLPSPAPIIDNKVGPVAMSCDAVANVRDPLWNILGQEGAGAFFCGHDHIYARGVAQDSVGNWVRQVIIGNGGAPAPVRFADDYNLDPFIESAARNAQFCCSAGTSSVCSPMFYKEFFEQPYITPATGTNFGYLVVEIHGSMAQATYKAKTIGPDGVPSGPYLPRDVWSWKFFAPGEEVENP